MITDIFKCSIHPLYDIILPSLKQIKVQAILSKDDGSFIDYNCHACHIKNGNEQNLYFNIIYNELSNTIIFVTDYNNTHMQEAVSIYSIKNFKDTEILLKTIINKLYNFRYKDITGFNNKNHFYNEYYEDYWSDDFIIVLPD